LQTDLQQNSVLLLCQSEIMHGCEACMKDGDDDESDGNDEENDEADRGDDESDEKNRNDDESGKKNSKMNESDESCS